MSQCNHISNKNCCVVQIFSQSCNIFIPCLDQTCKKPRHFPARHLLSYAQYDGPATVWYRYVEVQIFCQILKNTVRLQLTRLILLLPTMIKHNRRSSYIQTFFSNHLQIIYLVRAINSFCPQLLLLYPQKKRMSANSAM